MKNTRNSRDLILNIEKINNFFSLCISNYTLIFIVIIKMERYVKKLIDALETAGSTIKMFD